MSTINSTESTLGNIPADVKNAGKKAAFSPLMEALTRVGYGVRGLIYITMGILAFNVVLGKGGAPTDQQGAIAAIGSQPAGLILLWVILIGLASYSLWGVIRALLDPLHKGHDLKGLIARAGYLISAGSYTLLIPPTWRYITGSGRSPSSGASTQQSMASILSMPLGPWLLGALGLAAGAAGITQIFQSFHASFDKQFQTYAMTASQVKFATQLGRLGTATRGLIWILVGGAIVMAALQSNSNKDIGIDAALTSLLHQPYGVWLLGIVAVGLMAFGVYSVLCAVWFKSRR